MLSDAQLATLCDQMTSLLGITDRVFLEADVPGVVESMNTYTNRFLNKQDVEDKFRSVRDMREYFYLRQFPVTDVGQVTEDGVALAQDVDFELEPETGRLTRLSSGLPTTWKGSVVIDVKYTAGYDPLPLDLIPVLRDVVQHDYANKKLRDDTGMDMLGVQKVTLFDVGAIESTDVSGWESDAADVHPVLGNYTIVLDQYRVPVGTGGRGPHASSWLT